MCQNLNEEFDSVSSDGLQGHSAQPAQEEDEWEHGVESQLPRHGRSDGYMRLQGKRPRSEALQRVRLQAEKERVDSSEGAGVSANRGQPEAEAMDSDGETGGMGESRAGGDGSGDGGLGGLCASDQAHGVDPVKITLP